MAIAGLLGSFIENYDYSVYGFLVVYMAPLFFSQMTAVGSILASLAVFGVGYLARPLGGLLLGSLGDRVGRRRILLLTVIGMGVSTAFLGVLPTYDVAGWISPVLLVIARLAQGFSAGGELVGAATYVAESTPPRRRGFFQALSPLGAIIGVSAASAAVGITAFVMGAEAMATWGWRLPLLFSVLFTAIVLIYRLRLPDSPEFEQLAERKAVSRSPIRTVLRSFPTSIVAVAVMVFAATTSSAMLLSYMNLYLIREVGMPPTTVYWLSASVIALGGAGLLIGGRLVDGRGTRFTAAIGFGGAGILIYPAMRIMADTESVFLIALVYLVILLFSNIAVPAVFVTFVSLFPTNLRFTGSGIGYNIGAIAGGGLAPLLAGVLTQLTGNAQSPSLLLAGSALAAVIAIYAINGRMSAPELGPSHTPLRAPEPS